MQNLDRANNLGGGYAARGGDIAADILGFYTTAAVALAVVSVDVDPNAISNWSDGGRFLRKCPPKAAGARRRPPGAISASQGPWRRESRGRRGEDLPTPAARAEPAEKGTCGRKKNPRTSFVVGLQKLKINGHPFGIKFNGFHDGYYWCYGYYGYYETWVFIL